MTFTGLEDHSISLRDAAELTKNYRDAQTSDFYIKAEYFGQRALRSVLEQEDCVGLRIYYGQDSAGTPKLVIVGALSNGNDMDSGIILDKSIPCPYVCGVDNDLNS